MMLTLNIHQLKQAAISDNGYIEDLVFQSTLGTPEHV